METVDYYKIDDLLTDDQKLIRDSVKDWVNRSVKPIIDDYAQNHQIS
jgi:glutaryl-CoA dehydrogenase